MGIMNCPKCGGGGYIWEGDEHSTIGIQKRVCPSCASLGYVTDYVQAPPPYGSVKMWIKCPHCGKEIEVQQYQGTYTAIMPSKVP